MKKLRKSKTSDKPSVDVSEFNYIDQNLGQTYKRDMQIYTLHTILKRCVPEYRDGLKPIQRRILYSMYRQKAIKKTVKSAKTVGDVIGTMHPHGDASVYDAMPPLGNWFDCKAPVLKLQGNWGNFKGDRQAAQRYTESGLSEFGYDVYFSELQECSKIIEWKDNYDNTMKEPQYLPGKLPMLLINGTFAIAVVYKIEVPSHNLREVVDVCIKLMDDPNADFILIPDHCMPTEIIASDDLHEFREICNTGQGYYRVRGILEDGVNKKGEPYIYLKSVPNRMNADKVKEKVEDLVSHGKLTQIQSFQDVSDGFIFTLKKGANVPFIKSILYNHAGLFVKERVNMQALDGIDILDSINYREYLLNFITFRRLCKLRFLKIQYRNFATQQHQKDAYIKILESGREQEVIDKIRSMKVINDDQLIEWLIKEFKMTDYQAAFIINISLKNLSKAYLQKYKEESKDLLSRMKHILDIVRDQKKIDQIIKDEMLELAAKYGKPRMSKIITEAEAENKTSCPVNIIIDTNNNIKKVMSNDTNQKAYTMPAEPRLNLATDNKNDIIIFDKNAIVYRCDISKLPFANGTSGATKIRDIVPCATAPIIECMSMDAIKKSHGGPYVIITATHNGYVKKMPLETFSTVTTTGVLYAKLDKGNDYVSSITLARKDRPTDLLMITPKYAVRVSLDDIPEYSKYAKGNAYIGGITKLIPIDKKAGTKWALAITHRGYVNKVLTDGIKDVTNPSIIKLGTGDYIEAVYPIKNKKGEQLVIVTDKQENVYVDTISIPEGSTVSKGTKYIKGREYVFACNVK